MWEELLAKLLAEGAVIKQAPLAFLFIWSLGALITYIVLKRSFQARLKDKDDVIGFLEKKLELKEKYSPTPLELPPADPEGKPLTPPVLECLHFDFEDTGKDDRGFYFRVGKDFTGKRFKAAIIDFSLKPISGAVPWTEAQAQIRFKDLNDKIIRVSDAIWYGRDKPKVPFRYGVTRSLVLCACDRENTGPLSTYERDPYDDSRPLERMLGVSFIRAEVRLIGEYLDDPKADISWYFILDAGTIIDGKNPLPVSISKSTREVFDSADPLGLNKLRATLSTSKHGPSIPTPLPEYNESTNESDKNCTSKSTNSSSRKDSPIS